MIFRIAVYAGQEVPRAHLRWRGKPHNADPEMIRSQMLYPLSYER